MFDMQKMLKKAQEMQSKLSQVQDELAEMEVTGTAGGGLVTVTCNGKFEFKSVVIKPEALQGGAEELEDLVLAALKDATQKVLELTQQKMAGVTDGLNIPGLKLPF
ncbi:MAG: YbaB/EbfC family nucleoid-associated protein [Candidatus Melainabacteria bacterium]|nr:YbaB/EbfC family nucleoid-associated protein [Candidatus Melainabacteria bacterium]